MLKKTSPDVFQDLKPLKDGVMTSSWSGIKHPNQKKSWSLSTVTILGMKITLPGPEGGEDMGGGPISIPGTGRTRRPMKISPGAEVVPEEVGVEVRLPVGEAKGVSGVDLEVEEVAKSELMTMNSFLLLNSLKPP